MVQAVVLGNVGFLGYSHESHAIVFSVNIDQVPTGQQELRIQPWVTQA